ncbi:MAG: hypothetical protein R8F63_14700 [Acidimicrobiales bacterium]|nr:hypothetical protein [Acidimicrobiales bacterium]
MTPELLGELHAGRLASGALVDTLRDRVAWVSARAAGLVISDLGAVLPEVTSWSDPAAERITASLRDGERVVIDVDLDEQPTLGARLAFLDGAADIVDHAVFVGPRRATRHLALVLAAGAGSPRLDLWDRVPADRLVAQPADPHPPMVFHVSVGRSGSKAVADAHGLLHEPDGATPAIENVARRAAGQALYGETSHFWKGLLPELRRAYPAAQIVHLVRDGRSVVKSFQARSLYADVPGDLGYRNQVLPVHTPEMGRFERICWYWRYWNEEIANHAATCLRLEDLDLPARVNAGSSPAPWVDDETEVFERVCGELMARLGYE